MGILSETFGQAGTAVVFFGGQWWLVGLFLLLVFVTFLTAYRVNYQGIATFIVLGLLTISGYQIFIIEEQIVQTILFLIFMFVGFMAYFFLAR